MDAINSALDWLNGYLWGWPMVALLLGTHLFFTIRLRFIQRYTGLAIKLSFKKDSQGEGDVSHFGALSGVIVEETRDYLWSGRLEEGTQEMERRDDGPAAS